MKRVKTAALVTAALCAAVFLLALATLPPAAAHLEAPAKAGSNRTVPGAFHVHTRRSDGSGTVEQVAEAAARSGLRFVIFADHGDATRIDPPVYHSGVLCIDGVEVSADAGHFIGIGMRPSPYPLGGEGRDVIEDVARLGGFGVVAHPDSPKPALRWREWGVPVDAIEWLNADSEWRERPYLQLAHTMLEYPFRSPESIASLFSRPDRTLARWDTMTRQRRVVALAGADAHARIGFAREEAPYKGGVSLHLPSYEAMFRTFAIRVELDRPLTGGAGADARAVRDAIAAGHVYTAIDALATPPVFDFSATSGSFEAREGDFLQLSGPITVRAGVNAPRSTVVLLENGRTVATAKSRIEYRAQPGNAVFRVEVTMPGAPGSPPVPWIVSNPIYAGGLIDPRVAAVRRQAREYAPLAMATGEWAGEHDKSSTISIKQSSNNSLTVVYRLGGGPRGNQSIALAQRIASLGEFDRLQFRVSSARPMRLSVQLRADASAGGPRWQRSVYVDSAPRDVTVFLDDVRPAGSTPSWQPDRSTIGSLLFVVDTINARPGTAGSFTLENVRWGR